MTEIDIARAAILDLGSEDYYHLADAAVYLPSIPADQRAAVAREAMRQLLSERLVELHFGEFAQNKFVIVPLQEALRIIDEAQAWDPETSNPNVYCFVNTDAGDAVHYGGSRAQ